MGASRYSRQLLRKGDVAMTWKVTRYSTVGSCSRAANEKVEFGLDGISYAVQLTGEDAFALREALTTFIHAARRIECASE
ncbi:histone-like nucleoid-structuring protein Lsr2 [Micromonospora sp. NPDC047707]|uniref:Lsr2 dimerization domain-containing protein n=1 Tax=Micromonospora sp. NPDC047707 TaxID=3154498 RepID=UPI003451511D